MQPEAFYISLTLIQRPKIILRTINVWLNVCTNTPSSLYPLRIAFSSTQA